MDIGLSSNRLWELLEQIVYYYYYCYIYRDIFGLFFPTHARTELNLEPIHVEGALSFGE